MKVLKVAGVARGFSVIPIHYSHDPEKASPEWRVEQEKNFARPLDFQREFEIDFSLKGGKFAYPKFNSAKHLQKGLFEAVYDPRRPLHVGFDFNVDPMSIVVDQMFKQQRLVAVIKEFVYEATIDEIIMDFRSFFIGHKSDVIIYGDATKGTTPQTALSNWDVVRLAFRGFHCPIHERVPGGNPNVGDRLNSTNRLLSGDADYTTLIDLVNCPELAADLRQVKLTPDGKKILKVNDPDDPYSKRTHPSDAWGYGVYYRFPTTDEIVSEIAQKRAPMQPGPLLGEPEMMSRKELLKARKPMDRSRAR